MLAEPVTAKSPVALRFNLRRRQGGAVAGGGNGGGTGGVPAPEERWPNSWASSSVSLRGSVFTPARGSVFTCRRFSALASRVPMSSSSSRSSCAHESIVRSPHRSAAPHKCCVHTASAVSRVGDASNPHRKRSVRNPHRSAASQKRDTPQAQRHRSVTRRRRSVTET